MATKPTRAERAERVRADQAQRERDLVIVASMYCQGKKQHEIEEFLGRSDRSVPRLLQEIRARWVAYTNLAFDTMVSEELGRLETIEREAWEAWRASGNPTHEVHDTTTTVGTGKRAMPRRQRLTVQKQRLPDPRYLTIIQKCIDQRITLLGLAAPEQIQARIIRGEVEPDQQAKFQIYEDAIKDPAKARELIRVHRELAGAPSTTYEA